MDYYPNTIIEATPFIERRAPSGTDPLSGSVTPFLVEYRLSSNLVGGFLEQGESSGRPSYQAEQSAGNRHVTHSGHHQVPVDALTQLAMRRVALIRARNASPDPSVELQERLRILNERMNRQSPRVTEAHIRSIEDATTLGEQVASRRAARMALLSR